MNNEELGWRREHAARVWQASQAVLAFAFGYLAAYHRGLIEAYNDCTLGGVPRRGRRHFDA